MYNLEEWEKVNGGYRHVRTLIYNSPYPLCKGEKRKRETSSPYFRFYKIVKNGT